MTRRDDILRQIEVLGQDGAEAEDFLTRFSAAREEVEQEARLAYQRETARRAQAREAAIANANVAFLA